MYSGPDFIANLIQRSWFNLPSLGGAFPSLLQLGVSLSSSPPAAVNGLRNERHNWCRMFAILDATDNACLNGTIASDIAANATGKGMGVLRNNT